MSQGGLEEKISPYVLGIDLGTSTSECSVYRRGRGEVVNIFGQKVVPSVVNYREGADPLVGLQAKRRALTDPDNTIVSVSPGKKILVLSAILIARGAVEIYFKSSGGTALCGDATHKFPLDKTGVTGPPGFGLSFNPRGWFQTGKDEDLLVNLSDNVGVAGVLTYIEVE